MFKETKEGQTHFQNDGCGEPEHNDPPKEEKWEERFNKKRKGASFFQGKEKTGWENVKSFIRTEIEKAYKRGLQAVKVHPLKISLEDGKIKTIDVTCGEALASQLKEIRQLIENWEGSDIVDAKGVWINKSDLLKNL